MKNKIFIVTLCIIFTVSLIAYKKDKSEFTHEEYKVIREQVTKFFENEDFSCKNERNEDDYEEWAENSSSDDVYIDPVVCRRTTEKTIDGNVYMTSIKYDLISYDWMLYYMSESYPDKFYLQVESLVFPKEQLLNNDTKFSFYQETRRDTLSLGLDRYDNTELTYERDRYIYVLLSSSQTGSENIEYFQEVFKTGVPIEEKSNTENFEEVSDYFDLLVEKGYAENLLNEFKVNKEEADEIAKRFEKSEIYDKIYNLKY